MPAIIPDHNIAISGFITTMPRPIQAHIDLSALEHNLYAVRRYTQSRVMAVIKANAYGHGLMRAAGALHDAEGFALLDIADAVRLREAGFRQVMLLLEGAFSPEDMRLMAEYDLATVIHSGYQLEMLQAYPIKGGLSVWLKINTGMNRLGFAPRDVESVMSQLKSHAAIREITLMTHFASADTEAGIARQMEIFEGIAAKYRVPLSMANSAALIRYPASHGAWVRPGLMLYGSTPFADRTAAELGLKPVMSLRSEIISVREIQAGDAVGYGAMFRADRRMRIGVVACGYADGYPRHAPNGTPVWIQDRLVGTVGRVSMDMLCVDVSMLPDVVPGTRVTLWGAELPVEQVAAASGTIGYELLTALAARVPAV